MSADPRATAIAQSVHGTDFCIDLLPILVRLTVGLPKGDARVRAWLGFSSALAGIIAADTSHEDAELAFSSALKALASIKPSDARHIH